MPITRQSRFDGLVKLRFPIGSCILNLLRNGELVPFLAIASPKRAILPKNKLRDHQAYDKFIDETINLTGLLPETAEKSNER